VTHFRISWLRKLATGEWKPDLPSKNIDVNTFALPTRNARQLSSSEARGKLFKLPQRKPDPIYFSSCEFDYSCFGLINVMLKRVAMTEKRNKLKIFNILILFRSFQETDDRYIFVFIRI
jgi:hypothetical protein